MRGCQVEERVDRLEGLVHALEKETADLRTRVTELQQQLAEARLYAPAGETPAQRKFFAKWSVVVLITALIAVPSLALSVYHTNAFWSTFIAAINGLVLYIVGPGVWRLLMEGLFRAVPGVLFGQAARVAVDNYRKKKSR